MHYVAFVSHNRVPQRTSFDVEAEIVVFRGVGGHDFEQTRLRPGFAFAVYEHLAFGEVVGEQVQDVAVGLLLQGAHELEDALTNHGEETLLVVGNVGGNLVCAKGGFLFGGACGFHALLVVFGVGHLFPFFEQARVRAANHVAEVILHVEEFFVLVAVGNSLRKHLVDVIQMPEQNGFHAL